MRRILVLAVVAIMAFALCACGGTSESKSVDEEFMSSLAEGLEARWDYSNAEDNNLTTLDKEYWQNLFDAEYNEVSEYKDAEFENAELGELVNTYIASLDDSYSTLDYFDTDQWDSKYNNGPYQDRVASLYKINQINGIAVSDEYKTELKSVLLDGEVSVMVSKLADEIDFEVTEDDYGWKTYEAVIENTSSADFSVFDFSIDLIDKDGITVSTEAAFIENWAAGEKTRVSFETDKTFDKMDITDVDWDY